MVPNTLDAFRHYTNHLKTFKTPAKGPSYRCFRSFRPQVPYFMEQGGCAGLLQAEDNDGHQCKEKLEDLQILDSAAPSALQGAGLL